ncbi:hypothetical protein [Priestia megaterium]|uniref:hypothetical protein n=1 Tax=Priestia megaterium TaxID=1404 RepID=UPI003EE88659
MAKVYVSGNAGGTGNTFELSPNFSVVTQIAAVDVQPGQSITLKKVRFCLNDFFFSDNARLFVFTSNSTDGFISANGCGDEAPNLTLFTNEGSSTVTETIIIGIFNSSDPEGPDPTTINIFSYDGWSLNFKVA